MNKTDKIFIAILIVLSIAMYGTIRMLVIASTSDQKIAIVSYRDKEVLRIDMSVDGMYKVDGTLGDVIIEVSDTPAETLREMSDWFRNKVDSGIFVAGANNNGKPLLMVVVSDDLVKGGLHAGNIVREIAPVIGGGGGGRPNMAQAGGKDSDRLPQALARAREVIAASAAG